MKLPPFDHAHQAWDQYKAFHVHHYGGLFTQFLTGELRINEKPKPYQRRFYSEFNLWLVATRDRTCPQLRTPEGKSIPQVALNYCGQQYLMLDADTGKAYRLYRKRIPSSHTHFRGSFGGFLAPGDSAYDPEPIRFHVIDEDFKKTHEKEIRALVRACVVKEKLRPTPAGQWRYIRTVPAITLIGKSFADLDDYDIYRIARNGVAWPRKEITVPYALYK